MITHDGLPNDAIDADAVLAQCRARLNATEECT